MYLKEKINNQLKHKKDQLKDTEQLTKERMKDIEKMLKEDRNISKLISQNTIKNLKQQMESKNITIRNQNIQLNDLNKQIKEQKDTIQKRETIHKRTKKN